MSVEAVREYLKKWNRQEDIIEFDTSSATVELAARALGTEPARIAKSLTFAGEGRCIMVVTAGDRKIDNQKFKQRFLIKAKMLKPGEALDFTGHAVGGICPFALDPDKTTVYLDESLKRFDTVYPAAGSSNSCIQLTVEELSEYADSAGWVDVCRPVC